MGKTRTMRSLTLNSLALNPNYLKKSLKDNECTRACGKTCAKPCGKVHYKTAVAELKAQKLIELFEAPNCRLFFLKCVQNLTEDTVESIVESATRPYVKSPIKYFNYVAKRELEKKGL